MRITIILILFSISLSHAQHDTTFLYFENGKVKTIIPRLAGKNHGEMKSWYNNGQLQSISEWKNGQSIKTTQYYESGRLKSYRKWKGSDNMKSKSYYESGKLQSTGTWKGKKNNKSTMYHENGKKSYFSKTKKWKTTGKMWHKNGKLWTTFNSKYRRSVSKEYDSTGILLNKTIEKKGSGISCLVKSGTIDSTLNKDSTYYNNNYCGCNWGRAIWKDGVFIDERGRDLTSNYSSIRIDYYLNGKQKKETIWNKELQKNIIRKWDEKGNLIKEEK